jgi:cytochrome c-type biogenesis protein CcmF
VSYVAKVGSRVAPEWVTVVSLWSSLEGSILLWGGVLGLCTGVFAYVYRHQHREYMGYALGVMMMVAMFFTFLLAGPSDPFLPVSPVPADGPGANPLLQNHLLMVVHPPTLYVGFVGLTVPFGIALAAVLRGRMGEGWHQPLRVWTLIPWLFLTLGIVLGGWWAYEVLGWGGVWAWDPVENASLIPWLVATAYLHAAVVHQRRRLLTVMTLGLASLAFLLTILGTFMTRSGVFNSVHAFSQSSIGVIFLAFLVLASLVALGATAGRAHLLKDTGKFGGFLSREVAFLVFVVLLLAFTFTVLYGTVYPLITEAVRGVKVSVGEPYFNQMAVPLGLLILVMMILGPSLPWGRARTSTLLRSLAWPLGAGLATAIGLLVVGLREPIPIVTFALCVSAAFVSGRELVQPVLERVRKRQESFGQALQRTLSGHRRKVGGHTVHLAVLFVFAGLAGSHAYKRSAEASLLPGQSFTLGGYELLYLGAEQEDLPHRFAIASLFEVRQDGKVLGPAQPRLNWYKRGDGSLAQREPIGTPYVRTFAGVDVYLSLLNVESENQRASVKAFVNPMVFLLWASLPLFVLGTLFSVWPHRRREKVAATEAAGEKVPT